MQREAWTYSMTATVLGAFGVLLRWLQCEIIFDETTGLPVQNAPVSYLLVLFMAAAAAVLWWLSGRMTYQGISEEPEEALAQPGKLVGGLLTFAAVAVALGAVFMFFNESDPLFRITALLGLLAAPALAMTTFLPRWGGFGAFLSVLPVVFFSLWLISFYKDHAVNPIVWDYAVQVLAIAMCLMAAYRICGCVFYRSSPRRTIYTCALALVFCVSVLMDQAPLGNRVMFAGWGIGYGVLCWVLLYNAKAPENREENE